MALGPPRAIGGKVTIWRDIDRIGAGAVVDGEVETIAAGPREMRAPCSGERDAIWRNVGNHVIALAAVRKGHGSTVAGRARPPRSLESPAQLASFRQNGEPRSARRRRRSGAPLNKVQHIDL